jgi:hypothetical protein
MQKFVDAGQAEIPVRDRKFTIFIPLTVDANIIFDKFSNWCTAKSGNGMFKSYTTNNKKPNGENSTIYIIIDNRFFSGELRDDYLYQLHFETNQLKNRKNSIANSSIFESVMLESENVSNYFYNELMGMCKAKKTIKNNKYLDFLIRFGHTDTLFEMMDHNTPVIRFRDKEVPKLPDMSQFKNLDILEIDNARMVELHPSVGSLEHLEYLIIPNNRIKQIPEEVSKLKNLLFINMVGNPITEIPDSIKYLDTSNGGSLHRMAIRTADIGENNYLKLKTLLPNVQF